MAYIKNENFRRKKFRRKNFGGKSFGGKTLAEKVSDKFLNFGGKSFGQTFLSVKLSDRCFQQYFTKFQLKTKREMIQKGVEKRFFFTQDIYFLIKKQFPNRRNT